MREREREKESDRESERESWRSHSLTPGSDPCGLVEGLARAREQEYHQISMGQGQEDRARKAITSAILKGHWLMLQNCHLCLEFCEELIVTMVDTDEMHRNFKLWLTTDYHKDFPIGLLQISHKFTNEPPQGLRASLKRTYANIQQDTIDYSNHPAWSHLLYAVAFLHNVVQERKKFGAIGWNVKYDFNRADLMASYQFMMNHLDDLDPKRGNFHEIFFNLKIFSTQGSPGAPCASCWARSSTEAG